MLFSIDDRNLKRAGLDYWEASDLFLREFRRFHVFQMKKTLSDFEIRGNKIYSEVDLSWRGPLFSLCGREDKGLPEDFMREHPEKALRIPMKWTCPQSQCV